MGFFIVLVEGVCFGGYQGGEVGEVCDCFLLEMFWSGGGRGGH